MADECCYRGIVLSIHGGARKWYDSLASEDVAVHIQEGFSAADVSLLQRTCHHLPTLTDCCLRMRGKLWHDYFISIDPWYRYGRETTCTSSPSTLSAHIRLVQSSQPDECENSVSAITSGQNPNHRSHFLRSIAAHVPFVVLSEKFPVFPEMNRVATRLVRSNTMPPGWHRPLKSAVRGCSVSLNEVGSCLQVSCLYSVPRPLREIVSRPRISHSAARRNACALSYRNHLQL